MTGTTPEQSTTLTALERARLITDTREPFDVYIAMARLNLRNWFRDQHPDLYGTDVDMLVEGRFYGDAYRAFLGDQGGSAETEEGLLSMLDEYEKYKEVDV